MLIVPLPDLIEGILSEDPEVVAEVLMLMHGTMHERYYRGFTGVLLIRDDRVLPRLVRSSTDGAIGITSRNLDQILFARPMVSAIRDIGTRRTTTTYGHDAAADLLLPQVEADMFRLYQAHAERYEHQVSIGWGAISVLAHLHKFEPRGMYLKAQEDAAARGHIETVD